MTQDRATMFESLKAEHDAETLAQLSTELEKMMERFRECLQNFVDGVATLPESTWADIWSQIDPVKSEDDKKHFFDCKNYPYVLGAFGQSKKKPPRGPSPIESIAKDRFGHLFYPEHGRLETPDETTDDFTERRIAQAERVMALYKQYVEIVFPSDVLLAESIVDEQEESFKEFLAGITSDLVEAMALHTDAATK